MELFGKFLALNLLNGGREGAMCEHYEFYQNIDFNCKLLNQFNGVFFSAKKTSSS